jgi:hypothetical protein
MRAIPLAIAVLVSCVAPSAPAALPSASVALPSPSALRATLESRFAMVLPAPASPGSVWSPDQPLTLAPRAFGLFPVDRQPGPFVTFDRARLATALPAARPDAAVALVGSFDETWKVTIARVVSSPRRLGLPAALRIALQRSGDVARSDDDLGCRRIRRRARIA